MSRIGKLPIKIPQGVEIKINGADILVKGKHGELSWSVPEGVTLNMDGDTLTVNRRSEERQDRAFHGLARAYISNMVKGVHEGFIKELEIIGVGYRTELKGNLLILNLGYSHPIYFEVPEGIKLEVEERGTKIKVFGADKQKVGHVASQIRGFRPPEPYKGKGIRYKGEYVRMKEGKAKG